MVGYSPRGVPFSIGGRMEPDLLNILMNGGANLAFGIFLYAQNKDLQKRSDAREDKSENKEKELRDRYDKVIAELQAKEEAVRKELVSEMIDIDKRMSLLEQKVEHVAKIVEEIKAKFVRVSNAK
jgi:hypothetical protein